MKRIFSSDSEVTVVLTSCGRFDLLNKTLISFLKYNTYPINKIIITEDSGNTDIYGAIPEPLREQCEIIVNKSKLGQIRSIDKAYSLVKTKYIFHCEDDWEFYRSGFIEDSKDILEKNSNVFQVWLRSFYHDINIDYPFHSLGEKYIENSVVYYRLLSSDKKWQGFSFNPGLRRLSDYKVNKGGYSQLLDKIKYASAVESALSDNMVSSGMYAVILENDAVAHIGYDAHIKDKREIKKKRKKRTIQAIIAAGFLLIGFCIGIQT